jgi:hypothetical protein
LTRALGAIGERQGHDLVVSGEFDLVTKYVSLGRVSPELVVQRTLSRITNGPLTPPIVLYRIRGVTDIMRGSTMSGIVAEAERFGGGVMSLEVAS